jgi:hypothetical protein
MFGTIQVYFCTLWILSDSVVMGDNCILLDGEVKKIYLYLKPFVFSFSLVIWVSFAVAELDTVISIWLLGSFRVG